MESGSKTLEDMSAKKEPREGGEGGRLLSLLKASGKRIVDLADAADVTHPAARKWVRALVIQPGAWETCRKGLLALGFKEADLLKIKAGTGVLSHEDRDMVLTLTEGLSVDQARAMLRILETPEFQPLAMVSLETIVRRSKSRG